MIFKDLKSQPKTADKIIDGANMVIPAANPLCIKNKMAAKERVLRSNLLSKNS